MVTFAAPKVFEKQCAEAFPLQPVNHLRIFHIRDLVVNLALDRRLEHFGLQEEIKSFADRVKAKIKAIGPLLFHSLAAIYYQLFDQQQ